MRDAWTTRLWGAVKVLAVGLCIVLAAGCTHGADVEGDEGAQLNANKSDDQAEGSRVEPDPFDGAYRMVLESEVTTREPGGFFSGPSETVSKTTFYGVVQIVAQGATLGLEIQFCDASLPEVSGYVPSVAQSTIRGLAPISVQGERFITPEVTTFETSESAWVIGADLADPIAEPLPTDADDARIIDVEADGEPGVTLKLENWDIYGAMRLLFRLQGESVADGLLTGQAEIAMETAVFGDTVPLVNVATSLESAREDTTLVSESHRFELTRVTRGSLSCEQAFDGAPLDPEGRSQETTSERVDESGEPRVSVVVGGACVSDEDCIGTGARCLGPELGFPEGHCSTTCEGICPYQPEALPAVCAEVGQQGAWCFEGCEGSGDVESCREGFVCVSVGLVGALDTQVYACQPEGGLPEGPEDHHPEDHGPESPVEDCMAELIARGVGFEIAASPNESPPGHPELQCTIEEPIMVDGTLAGVNYRYALPDASVKRIYVSCRLALAMHDTALLAKEAGVTDIVHLGAYNCRTITGTSTLSQHGLGKAIDIAGVRLEDGTYWSIFDDWEHDTDNPEEEGAQWLSWFANQLYAQWIFNLILTPNYDASHDDHLHCDLSPDTHEIH